MSLLKRQDGKKVINIFAILLQRVFVRSCIVSWKRNIKGEETNSTRKDNVS